MSEARSLTNFVGNGVAAIVVSRWERELDTATLARELASGPQRSVPQREEVPESRVISGRKRAKIRETFSAAAGNRWVDTWNAQCPLPGGSRPNAEASPLAFEHSALPVERVDEAALLTRASRAMSRMTASCMRGISARFFTTPRACAASLLATTSCRRRFWLC